MRQELGELWKWMTSPAWEPDLRRVWWEVWFRDSWMAEFIQRRVGYGRVKGAVICVPPRAWERFWADLRMPEEVREAWRPVRALYNRPGMEVTAVVEEDRREAIKEGERAWRRVIGR